MRSVGTTRSPNILIVDDQVIDAVVIRGAVELCLALLNLGTDSIRIARSKDEAIRLIGMEEPELLITDLFMPERIEGGFSALPLNSQYNEMEWPKGLELLDDLAGSRAIRKLVVTFFWNYAGFSRYTDAFYQRLHVDAALPKDVFFLVASLDNPDNLKAVADDEDFPPLRILLQALSELLAVPGKTMQNKDLESLRLRFLFGESCAWLRTYPHHVLDVRDGIRAVSGIAPAPKQKITPAVATIDNQVKKKKNNKLPSEASSGEIARHMAASAWMPAFVFTSVALRDAQGPGSYSKLITVLNGDSWSVDIETPSVMALVPDDGSPQQFGPIQWDGKERRVSYRLRDRRALQIEGILLPTRRGNNRDKEEDREWAKLLATLGFFSYWCHLPDHRALRTSAEIADVIAEANNGNRYRKAKTAREAADWITNDILHLGRYIERTIEGERHNDWWRFLGREKDLHVFGRTRMSSSDTGYWLNGSIRFRGRRLPR